MRANISRTYRLSGDEAHDLVRDALIAVCVAHGARAYDNLAGALTLAASNKARDDWRRRRRYGTCRADESVPSCTAAPDASVHFEQEQRAVDAALCQEDQVSARIIKLRIVGDADFAEVGREVGLTADEARTRFHNAIRRVQKRVAEACPR